LTLGELIREARVGKELTLRGLARDLGLSPSYINDVEQDRRVPSEPVLRRLGEILELDIDRLLGIAGRVGADAERYLKSTPSAGVLFRKMSDAQLDDEDVRRLIKRVDEIANRENPKRRG
jgi:transcriptional regulator with XRE-family HTH domain